MSKLRVVSVSFLLILIAFLSTPAQTPGGQAMANSAMPSPTGQAATSQTGGDDRYRIGYQDVLEIQIDRHADLNQRVPVNPNGTINLFRLNRPIIAVCKTDSELATDIANAYKENYLRDPQVHVIVAEQKSQSIAVIGAVEKPGNFYVTRRVHLLEMLAMGTRLIVARTGSTGNCKATGPATDITATNDSEIALMGFKIRDVQQGKESLWMQPGDVVSVLDADTVYVYGNVIKQGFIKVRDPITLRQAIASSEGLKPSTKKDHIRILRQLPNSIERTELVFDLNQIEKGKATDHYLEPGDIVAVSEDKVKAILNGITNTIKTTVPSAAYRFP